MTNPQIVHWVTDDGAHQLGYLLNVPTVPHYSGELKQPMCRLAAVQMLFAPPGSDPVWVDTREIKPYHGARGTKYA